MAYNRKTDKDLRCPLEYGLDVFGGKWNSRVICVLAKKEVLRYKELRDEMGHITDSVLSTTLRHLIEHGMIERISYNEIPPRVEYCLTDKGKSVVPILHQICLWSDDYFKPEGPMHCKGCRRD